MKNMIIFSLIWLALLPTTGATTGKGGGFLAGGFAAQRRNPPRCPPKEVEFCRKLVRGELKKGYFGSIEELEKALARCAELKERGCF
jgi:hypothetical protein